MAPRPTLAISTATLADQAYEVLQGLISTGEYPPGQVLRELDLVARLGVSRTPIREALLRLGEYGLVSLMGRSARVRQVTRDEVVHIYQVRMALELEAISAACGRLTPEDFALLDGLRPKGPKDLNEPSSDRLGRQLHLLIAQRSGNPILFREIRRMLELIRLAHNQLADSREWLVRELEEHTAIIAALRANDKKRCRQALRKHLQSACRTNVQCAQAEAAAGRPAISNQ